MVDGRKNRKGDTTRREQLDGKKNSKDYKCEYRKKRKEKYSGEKNREERREGRGEKDEVKQEKLRRHNRSCIYEYEQRRNVVGSRPHTVKTGQHYWRKSRVSLESGKTQGGVPRQTT